MRNVLSAMIFVIGLTAVRAHAFTNRAIYLGVGLFAENSFYKQTASATGEKSILGTFSLPLIVKYDWQVTGDYFFAPTLTYTPIGRDDAGSSATVTLAHLMLPVGKNISFGGMDLYFGPGFFYRFIKGAGGTEVLSNGNSSALFGRPSRSVSTTTYTLNLGASFMSGQSSRWAFDLVTEGTFSEKRTFNMMFSYCYQFAGVL